MSNYRFISDDDDLLIVIDGVEDQEIKANKVRQKSMLPLPEIIRGVMNKLGVVPAIANDQAVA